MDRSAEWAGDFRRQIVTANMDLPHSPKRGAREARSLPFSSCLPAHENGDDESNQAAPAVDADRFFADDHPRWAGHWQRPPEAWGADRLQSIETLEHIERAIAKLPANQREVITLRDVEDFTSEEVREMLGISESNQRVLLHRARSKVRAAIESYMKAAPVLLRPNAPATASPTVAGEQAVTA